MEVLSIRSGVVNECRSFGFYFVECESKAANADTGVLLRQTGIYIRSRTSWLEVSLDCTYAISERLDAEIEVGRS